MLGGIDDWSGGALRCGAASEICGSAHCRCWAESRKGITMNAPEDQDSVLARYKEGPELLERALAGIQDSDLDAPYPQGPPARLFITLRTGMISGR